MVTKVKDLSPQQIIQKMQSATDEQLAELLFSLPEGDRKAIEKLALVQIAQLNHNPKGFAAYFRLMQGTPLHKEGEKWNHNAYLAHSQGKGLLQECFRESGKTTVFSVHFASWIIGRNPHTRSGLIRINDDKACKTTSTIAKIISDDPNWKLVFPNIEPDEKAGWGANGYNVRDTSKSNDEWAQIMTKAPVGPTFVGYGWTSGSIIGSRYNGFAIIDDIHDRDNTRSEKELAEVKGFYKDTLTYCLMKGVWEIWNYTPWKTNDLYAYLDTLRTYVHSKSPVAIPAEEGEEGAELWPYDEDVSLSNRYWKLSWPEVWGFDRLTDKYINTGPIDFARSMLLDLEATKGINLKSEWLHDYPASEIDTSWPVIMGIDYASTQDKLKDKDRDYFALAIMRAIPGGGIVLVDGYRGQISKGEALDLVMNRWYMYPTTQKIGVESIGKGEEFYNDLNLLHDTNGRIPPLMAIKHGRRSKGERFEEWLAPRCQMSRIWISNAENSFINRFKDEWLLWPSCDHDDVLDAVYMAAFSAEGFMPAMAERTFDPKKKTDKSFIRALGGRRVNG